MKNSDLFSKFCSTERLNDMFGKEDYYWYLSHSAFVDTCIKYTAEKIHELGDNLSVLDLGCGLGDLLKYLPETHYYCGIDGSNIAIAKAINKWEHRPNTDFGVQRIEDFAERTDLVSFDVILFGNILVFSKNGERSSFIELFVNRTKAKYVVVYDLQRTRTHDVAARYELLSSKVFDIKLDKLKTEVKKHRKVEVYKV